MPSAHVRSRFFRIILERAYSSSVREIRPHPPSWLSNWLSEPPRQLNPKHSTNRAVSNPFAEEVEVQDHSHE